MYKYYPNFCQNSVMIAHDRRTSHALPALICVLALLGCEPHEQSSAAILATGHLANPALDEASGMQAARLRPEVYFLHNDDGPAVLYAVGPDGADLGRFSIEGAQNRDWEDLAAVPSEAGPLLLIADSGDNFAQHDRVRLYFVLEPEPGPDGRYAGSVAVQHVIELEYPGGSRDCESVAWDPDSDRIYLISKRDKPAGVYSIAREAALTQDAATLTLDGSVHPFRPPTARDMRAFGRRDGPWVSQPTGLDISPDGREAAVISYRSLYLFERQEGESWPEAFARKPLEFEGPPSHKEEAVAYSADGTHIMITTEGLPAPMYRFRLHKSNNYD